MSESAINFAIRMAFEKAMQDQPGDEIDLRGGHMNIGRYAFLYLDRDTQSRWESWQQCWKVARSGFDEVVVARDYIQRLMDMMVYGDIDEKCDFGPWREIFKQTKAYLDPR